MCAPRRLERRCGGRCTRRLRRCGGVSYAGPVERGKLIADRYELIGRLGRGGMGEVWAARDRVLHREVALKLLDLDGIAQADLPRRFEREAVAAAQIVHPNVAALYDRGIHDDVLFLVMEKVDGQTLTARLQAESPFPLTRAVAIASGVCAALEAAHRAQVIHYDIKPHNVILTGDGLVKVIDFGIAGFVQAAFTVARSSQLTPAGTPEFGAPEQFLTERGDERSDLYALGGMLFAMLMRPGALHRAQQPRGRAAQARRGCPVPRRVPPRPAAGGDRARRRTTGARSRPAPPVGTARPGAATGTPGVVRGSGSSHRGNAPDPAHPPDGRHAARTSAGLSRFLEPRLHRRDAVHRGRPAAAAVHQRLEYRVRADRRGNPPGP